jgi:hypothetical protein
MQIAYRGKNTMAKFNITDKELAEALEITLDKLAEICDEFDRDADDDWDLIKDFHFVIGPYDSRVFSPEGAVEICNYLETNQSERPLLKRWKRWLLRRDEKLKGLMVAKKIEEINSFSKDQIVFRQNRAFLAPRACREVLGLGKRQDVLRKTFVDIQRNQTDPERQGLILNEDFFPDPSSEDIDNKKNNYFSRSGLARVAMQLSVSLTQKHRKEWARSVAEYAPKALVTIEKYEADRENRVKRVMEQVRKQAQGRCQITNRRKTVHKFDLEVHHLFDKNTYPQFADMEINLIAIASDIHTHFHQWMGGSHISCTVEDMEKYIEEFRNSLFVGDDGTEQATKVAIRLSKTKGILTSYVKNIA